MEKQQFIIFLNECADRAKENKDKAQLDIMKQNFEITEIIYRQCANWMKDVYCQ